MKFLLLSLAGSFFGRGLSLPIAEASNLLASQAAIYVSPKDSRATPGRGIPSRSPSHELLSYQQGMGRVRNSLAGPQREEQTSFPGMTVMQTLPNAQGMESSSLSEQLNSLDMRAKHEKRSTISHRAMDTPRSLSLNQSPRSHATQQIVVHGIFRRAGVPEPDWVTKAKLRAQHADDMAQRRRMPSIEAERATEAKAIHKEVRTAARKDIKEANRALDHHLQQTSGQRVPSPVRNTFKKAHKSINDAYAAGMSHASHAAEAAASAEERGRWSEVRGHISSSARATGRAHTIQKLGHKMQVEQDIAIHTSENAAQPKSITDRVDASRYNMKQLQDFKNKHREYDAAYRQNQDIRRTFSGSSSEEEYMPRERNQQ